MSDEKPQSKTIHALWAVGVFICTFSFHTFAFPPFDVAEFAYIVPIPALMWLFYQQPSRKVFFRIVAGAFWLSWLVLIVWLRHVTWVGWFGLATILSVFPAVWALAVWWIVPRFMNGSSVMRLAGILCVSSIWTLLEFVRTYLFSGFPWLPLAASQWERPLALQVASWTGYYGVSFLLIFVGVAIAFYARHLFKGRQKGWFHVCPEFLIAMVVWIFATFGLFQIKFQRAERKTFFKAALIQPYVPQNEKWDSTKAREIMSEIERQMLFQKHIGADIAMLPEAVLPYAILGDPAMRASAEQLAEQFEGPVLMGALAAEGATLHDDPWYNGIMILYPEKGLAQPYYKKRKLVPFGEYIPFRNLLFFLEKFVPIGEDIFPGKSPKPLQLELESGPLPIGALICYEDIFPGLARSSVKAGARVLFVATNDAWYGEEGAAYQHAAHSVLRAVETFRPVVRVGNGGWSGWIDEYGIIRQVLESAEGSVYFRGSEVVEVTYDPNTYRQLTFFVRYGNWFVWVCLAIVACFIFLLRKEMTHVSEDEEWEKVSAMKINVPKDGYF
jgi:apolipoprotein N-acyltransferase